MTFVASAGAYLLSAPVELEPNDAHHLPPRAGGPREPQAPLAAVRCMRLLAPRWVRSDNVYLERVFGRNFVADIASFLLSNCVAHGFPLTSDANVHNAAITTSGSVGQRKGEQPEASSRTGSESHGRGQR
jgi:hypothetical protein